MQLYVINGQTESGDDYLYIWQNKPTVADIYTALMDDWPDEFDEDGNDVTMNIPGLVTIYTED